MRLLAPVLDLLAPPRCVSCGVPGDPLWCADCRGRAGELRVVGPCPRCAGPAGPAHPCWPAGSPIARTIAVWRYAGPVADAIVAGKARGAAAAWPRLGEELAARCREVAVDVVTWVPTRARSRRARGTDHALRLATVVADRLDLPLRGLLRAAPGVDQSARTLGERRRLPADAVRRLEEVGDARVLLVDDVLTTGATLEVAAAALAARRPVAAAVLARAGRHPLGAYDPGRRR